MMAHIWTVFRPHREPLTGFGHLAELPAWLDGCRLPGVAPVDWIVDVLLGEEHTGRFSYIHDEAGPDEWRLVTAPARRRVKAV
ncbi:hypothetical protein ACXHXG_30345 [Rhizobium sp. LEGMi198b]